MNQEEFGALIGVSRATVARMESGETEIPAWVDLAREGWRQRRGFEAEIRRIVREEMRVQGITVLPAPTQFAEGQIYRANKTPNRTATVTQVQDGGRAAWVEVRDDANPYDEGRVVFAQFINHWTLVPSREGFARAESHFERGQTYRDKNQSERTAEVIAVDESGLKASINIYDSGKLVRTGANVDDLSDFLRGWFLIRTTSI